MQYDTRSCDGWGSFCGFGGRPKEDMRGQEAALVGPSNGHGAASETIRNGFFSFMDTEPDEFEPLRSRLAPVKITDLSARRFMKAAKDDVELAATNYKAMLEWRGRSGVDRPLPSLPKAAAASLDAFYRPRILDGLDLEGRPVLYNNFGAVDWPEMQEAGVTLEMVARRHATTMEMLMARIDSTADPMKGHLLMIDVGDASAWKFLRALDLWKTVTAIGDTYYPESLGKLIIVRCPTFADGLIGIIKGFLDDSTKEKMEFASGDPGPVLTANLPLSTRIPTDIAIGPWPAAREIL